MGTPVHEVLRLLAFFSCRMLEKGCATVEGRDAAAEGESKSPAKKGVVKGGSPVKGRKAARAGGENIARKAQVDIFSRQPASACLPG